MGKKKTPKIVERAKLLKKMGFKFMASAKCKCFSTTYWYVRSVDEVIADGRWAGCYRGNATTASIDWTITAPKKEGGFVYHTEAQGAFLAEKLRKWHTRRLRKEQ